MVTISHSTQCDRLLAGQAPTVWLLDAKTLLHFLTDSWLAKSQMMIFQCIGDVSPSTAAGGFICCGSQATESDFCFMASGKNAVEISATAKWREIAVEYRHANAARTEAECSPAGAAHDKGSNVIARHLHTVGNDSKSHKSLICARSCARQYRFEFPPKIAAEFSLCSLSAHPQYHGRVSQVMIISAVVCLRATLLQHLISSVFVSATRHRKRTQFSFCSFNNAAAIAG